MSVNRDGDDFISESVYYVNKKLKIRHLLSVNNLFLFSLTQVNPNPIVHNSSYFGRHVHQAKMNRAQIKKYLSVL